MDDKIKERITLTFAVVGGCATLISLIINVKNYYENKAFSANQKALTALQLADAKKKAAADAAAKAKEAADANSEPV